MGLVGVRIVGNTAGSVVGHIVWRIVRGGGGCRRARSGGYCVVNVGDCSVVR